MQTLIEIAISWGPMILLIGVWVYFIRKSGGMKQSKYLDEYRDYLPQHLKETEKLNSNLERIAIALEKISDQKIKEKINE